MFAIRMIPPLSRNTWIARVAALTGVGATIEQKTSPKDNVEVICTMRFPNCQILTVCETSDCTAFRGSLNSSKAS
jgi:hypothetical protein